MGSDPKPAHHGLRRVGGGRQSGEGGVFVDLAAKVLLEEVGELLGEALRRQDVMLCSLSGKAPVVSSQLAGRGDGMQLAEFSPASWGRRNTRGSSC